MSTGVRVLVADDHPAARAGVAYALEAAGFEVCAMAEDAEAAVSEAARCSPDVCLLDVHMPGNGISAAGRITARLPQTVVVMLTVSRNDADLFDSLRAGAAGYLLKDIDPRRLPAALEGVLKGEAALPRTLVAQVIEEFRERGRRRRLPLFATRGVELTSREWEVLELMRDGLTTGEIAARLFVTQATVRSHVAAILKKLRVPDRKSALALLER
ncbi:MAG TPA: response regulator transcription factor [Gaiellaceae bacterium]|nr:response regulator transcription factor [Gaiellaceae bacterium]